MEEINSFVKWCDDNYLYLNVSKTKRCVLILGRAEVFWIKGEVIDRVSTQKHLGIIFNNKLLLCIVILLCYQKHKYKIVLSEEVKIFWPQCFFAVFYSAVVYSSLTFGVVCWGGNVS